MIPLNVSFPDLSGHHTDTFRVIWTTTDTFICLLICAATKPLGEIRQELKNWDSRWEHFTSYIHRTQLIRIYASRMFSLSPQLRPLQDDLTCSKFTSHASIHEHIIHVSEPQSSRRFGARLKRTKLAMHISQRNWYSRSI
jgi:hypothetical protein